MFLLGELPETARICGAEYQIRTDFRYGLLHDALVRDGDFSAEEKAAGSIALFFRENLPADERHLTAALHWISWFVSCGDYDPRLKARPGAQIGADTRIFSLEHDGGYVYAAFLSEYGIDLHREKMHWWKFRALLDGLPGECGLRRITELRAVETGGMDKEQKRHFQRLKRIYRLPDTRRISERDAALRRAFGGLPLENSQ